MLSLIEPTPGNPSPATLLAEPPFAACTLCGIASTFAEAASFKTVCGATGAPEMKVRSGPPSGLSSRRCGASGSED